METNNRSVEITDAELKAIARMPEAIQLVIDHHHVQEAQADAVDCIECVRYSEKRREVLEALRDELLKERGEVPGEITFIYHRPQPSPAQSSKSCGCVSPDKVECLRARYAIPGYVLREDPAVRTDFCDCACHQEKKGEQS